MLTVTVLATIAVVPSSFLAGWIVDRYGPRRLIFWSQIAFGCIFIGLGLFTRSLTALYVWYFLMPLAAIGTMPVTFSKVLSAHFSQRRGLALGIALSGTGLCALTIPALVTWVISRWDWRAGYVAAGLVPLLIAAPLTFAWIRDPLRSSATHEEAAKQLALTGMNLRQALLGWRFWVMTLAFFCVSGSATGLLANLIPLLADRGYAASAGVSALGVFGIAVVIGRLSVGALVDRFWAPLVGLLFLLPACAAVLLLAQPTLPWAATLAALVVVGLATGAELDLAAYLVSRYFGVLHFGKIYGTLFIAFAAGAALTGPVFGWVYDHYGSYRWAVVAAGLGYGMCGLLLPTLGRFPALRAWQ